MKTISITNLLQTSFDPSDITEVLSNALKFSVKKYFIAFKNKTSKSYHLSEIFAQVTSKIATGSIAVVDVTSRPITSILFIISIVGMLRGRARGERPIQGCIFAITLNLYFEGILIKFLVH